MAAPAVLLIILGSMLALVVGVLAIIYLVVPAMKGTARGVGWIFRGIGAVVVHFYRFIAGMITDTLRMVGMLLASVFLAPLAAGNVLIGRWSSAAHFGREFSSTLGAAGRSLYRVVVGHPARFLLLGPMLDEIEHRVPDAVAQAPGADRPSKKVGQFDGYTIVGSLPGGGSGGKLYVAEPTDLKRAALQRSTGVEVDQVVIKSFSVREGSTVPQIVRESRALEAARKLGLVLDHELTDERFFYVMPFVPGESLTLVTRRMHSESPIEGLDARRVREAIGYIADLVATLDRYHHGGLWHKDVKPDNIIVHGGRAELVDFGLITPLRSAMTLTTHGTEYFRDPEMVRLALRGVKVHEVNGVKFDVYGAGAVLFSVIENSFPAHGGLSQIGKRCPEALRWVVRRAMTDINSRYADAAEMLADLRALQNAPDVFALKPADLPSVRGGAEFTPSPVVGDEEFAAEMGKVARAASPVPPAAAVVDASIGAGVAGASAVGAVSGVRKKPRLVLTDWWTGRYAVGGEGSPAAGVAGAGAARVMEVSAGPVAARAVVGHGKASGRQARPRHGRPAASAQLKSARARVQAAQRRAQDRRRSRSARGERFDNKPNVGVVLAALLPLGCVIGVAAALLIPGGMLSVRRSHEGFATDGGMAPGAALRYDAGGGETTLYLDTDEVVLDADVVRESVSHSVTGVSFVRDRMESGAEEAPEPVRGLFVAPERMLLVINDLAVGERERERGYVDYLVRAIADENMGITEDADLMAGAKAVIGLRHASDADAREDLAAWLLEKVDPSVMGVVWIDADPESPEEVDRRLITRTPLDSVWLADAMQSIRSW